jgi:hypothetical protein
MVTDGEGKSALVTAGILPRGSGLKPGKAVELNGWIARQQVFRALLRLTRSIDEKDIWVSWDSAKTVSPFGIKDGECLYDTGSLFLYPGPRSKSSTNVLMVLWSFPLKLQARKRGDGRLNPGPAAGGLTSGDITWDIVAVNSPVEDRIGDWDQAMKAMTIIHNSKSPVF